MRKRVFILALIAWQAWAATPDAAAGWLGWLHRSPRPPKAQNLPASPPLPGLEAHPTDCSNDDRVNPFAREVSFARLAQGIPPCALPEIGQSHVIQKLASEVPSSVAPHYILTRLPDHSDGSRAFQVAVNFNFDPRKNGTGRSWEQWRADTKRCFDQASPYLRGPEGETIELRLTDPSEKRLGKISQNISLEETASRGSDLQWKKEFDCSIVLHETLHHLGLVDGYEETDEITDPKTRATSKKYRCRSREPEDSIMTSPSKAYDRVRESSGRMEYFECTCFYTANKTESEQCNRSLAEASTPVTQCPAGTHQEFFHDSKFDEFSKSGDPKVKEKADAIEARVAREPVFKDPTYHFPVLRGLKRTAASPASLLNPAQFNMIIYPGCQAKNQLYTACSINAYRSDSCKPVPEACRDPRALSGY